MGLFYDNGTGVAPNQWLSAHWFMRASCQGDQTSIHNLGIMWEFGEGVPKDCGQAGRVLLFFFFVLFFFSSS